MRALCRYTVALSAVVTLSVGTAHATIISCPVDVPVKSCPFDVLPSDGLPSTPGSGPAETTGLIGGTQGTLTFSASDTGPALNDRARKGAAVSEEEACDIAWNAYTETGNEDAYWYLLMFCS